MLPACTVMSIANRASYCYSGWLCIVLSSAILAGHGYYLFNGRTLKAWDPIGPDSCGLIKESF